MTAGKRVIMDKRNLTLLTDLYELTMMQGYFKYGNTETVVFDAFYKRIRVKEVTRSAVDWSR